MERHSRKPQDPYPAAIPMVDPEIKHLHIWDIDEPRSVINLLSTRMQSLFLAAKEKEPSYFEIPDEIALRKRLTELALNPFPTDNRIRLAFWMEYNRVYPDLAALEMDARYILSGTMDTNHFYSVYLKQPHRIAWMVCPPTNMVQKLDEGIAYGIDKMRSILEMQPVKTDPKGKLVIDTRLVGIQLQILKMFDMRRNGAYTQKTVSLQMHTKVPEPRSLDPGQEMLQIEQRIKELEQLNHEAQHLPKNVVADVEPDGST